MKKPIDDMRITTSADILLDHAREIERLESELAEARNKALEEAAIVCVERIGTGPATNEDFDTEALECAMQIRTLKTPISRESA